MWFLTVKDGYPSKLPYAVRYQVMANKTRKLSYRKDDLAMRPIGPIWVPENFPRGPEYAHGYFSQILTGFCSDRSHECAYKI